MNQSSNPSGDASRSAFLPVTLCALALLLFFVWQFVLVWKNKSAIKVQVTQRDQMVGQARTAQSELQRICMDLLELGKTDPEAKAIAEKYGISFTPPAAGAPTPAPAAK
jgi:hypothetical protein